MPRHAKALKFKRPLSAKRRALSNQKIVEIKVFGFSNSSWKVETRENSFLVWVLMKSHENREKTSAYRGKPMIVRKIGKRRKVFQYFWLDFTQKLLNQLITNSFIVKINEWRLTLSFIQPVSFIQNPCVECFMRNKSRKSGFTDEVKVI